VNVVEKRPMNRRFLPISIVVVCFVGVAHERHLHAQLDVESTERSDRVRNITMGEDAVPVITADDEDDAIFMQGYVHARDRFFNMDTSRRLFAGGLFNLLPSDNPGLETVGGGFTFGMERTPLQIHPDTYGGWILRGDVFGRGFASDKQLNQPGGSDFEGSGTFGVGAELGGLLRHRVTDRLCCVCSGGATAGGLFSNSLVVPFDPTKEQIIIDATRPPKEDATYVGGFVAAGFEFQPRNALIVRTILSLSVVDTDFLTNDHRADTVLGVRVELLGATPFASVSDLSSF